jgi:hypothetical protein
MGIVGKVLGPLGRGFGGTVVKVGDPHPEAVPAMARYTKAAEASANRERAALKLKGRWQFLGFAGMAWGALMTWDNRVMVDKMEAIARHKAAMVVERTADGHQYERPLDVVGDVSMGTRMQDALYFVTWFREVGTNPVQTDRNRAAARARLAGGAERKWDALVGRHCREEDGCVADVTDVVVEPGEHDPDTRQTALTVTWIETIYDKAFEARSRTAMAMGVVTRDGEPRKGVLDGVSVVGFTEPRALQALPPPAAEPRGGRR